jgi:hypothetical protein
MGMFVDSVLQVVWYIRIKQPSAEAVPYVRRLVAGFPRRQPGFELGSGYVGFVVDKVALVQVFSEYSGFFCQYLFYQLLHNIRHVLSGAGTIL